jgi:hypothetical protein
MKDAANGDNRAAWERLLHSRNFEADYAEIFDHDFIQKLTDFLGNPATNEGLSKGVRELVDAYLTAKLRITLRKPAKLEARHLHALAQECNAAAKSLRMIEKRGNAALKFEHVLRRRMENPEGDEASLLRTAYETHGKGAIVTELAALIEEMAAAARAAVLYGDNPEADTNLDLDSRMHARDLSEVPEERAKHTGTYAVGKAVAAFQFTWLYSTAGLYTEGTYIKGLGYVSEALELLMKIFGRLDPEVRQAQVAATIRRVKNKI